MGKELEMLKDHADVAAQFREIRLGVAHGNAVDADFALLEGFMTQLDEQFQQLLAEAIDADDKEACNAQFTEILTEQTALKKQKETILQSSTDADHVCTRMKQAEQAIENTAQTITEWNENAVRQIVERVTVLSADEVLVRIKGGAEIKQRLEGK